MKTEFSLAQLADPDIAEADKILRACVHCGFCTATCPTYVLLGDELDSPRGRIYLIKEMLEKNRPPTALLPSPKAASATPTLLRRIKAMLALAPGRLPAPGPSGGSVFPALGERRGRVALLQGCAQQVLAPRINQAAINLLTRHGIEVVLVKDEQCCGALTH